MLAARLSSLAQLASLLVAGSLVADEPAESPEAALFRKANLKADDASLIAYLRDRSSTEDPARIEELVRQLGSERFQVREKATERLLVIGPAALPTLNKYFKDRDAELAGRARDCAAAIERNAKDVPAALPLAAVRLLARSKADGAVEALLHFLPHTSHEATEEEVYYSLDALARKDGKPHPALVAALTDRAAACRAATGCILGRIGGDKVRGEVR